MSIHADEVLTREVEKRFPAFCAICADAEIESVLISQSLIGSSDSDLILFAKAVKYAGLKGKEVRVLL